MIGRTLGHYSVTEKLGEGGMGVVYKALDTRLDRCVVLKVIRADQLADPDRKRRFVQEARAASALDNVHIVKVHDIASEGDIQYIVMEHVPGQPLDFVIPSGGLPADVVIRYGMQICEALETAHAAGIIHRDLKPANVMVTADGTVKLLDFGLAKLTSTWSGGEITGPKTLVGSIVGTVAYMSPEQALAQPLDARADVFGLGALLYEMATGRRAFGNASSLVALTAVLRDQPVSPASLNPAVPHELAAVILRCLEKAPEQRFASAASVREALAALPASGASVATGDDPLADAEMALRGLSAAGIRKARALFEKGLSRGYDEARVYAGIAEAYALSASLGLREPAEVWPKAAWAARKAPQDESAAVTAALTVAYDQYAWEAASDQLRRVTREGSRLRRALWLLRPMGRFDEALRDAANDPPAHAWIALECGDVDAASSIAADCDLGSWIGCWVRAWSLLSQGRFRHAAEACSAGLELEPESALLQSALATACVFLKDSAGIRRLIEQPHWRPASFAVPVWAALGQPDQAFAAAERAVKSRDPLLVTSLRMPACRRLQSDPRYAAILAAMNLR